MKSTSPKINTKTSAFLSGAFMLLVAAFVLGFAGFGLQDVTSQSQAQNTVVQNEEAEFTFNEAGAPPSPPRSVSINVIGDSTVDAGEAFTLSWDSENISTLDSYGKWGSSALPTNTAANTSRSESSPGTYTYGVVADEATNPITDEVTVTVLAPPENFNYNFVPITNVDIDGEPGSTASTNLVLESEYGYSGTIDIEIIDVRDDNGNSYGPDFLDGDGNKIINITHPGGSFTLQGSNATQFASAQAALSSGSSETIPITLETMKPINEDTEYTVEIRMDDLSNTADEDPQTGEFKINADGFAPRTIEEF